MDVMKEMKGLYMLYDILKGFVHVIWYIEGICTCYEIQIFIITSGVAVGLTEWSCMHKDNHK